MPLTSLLIETLSPSSRVQRFFDGKGLYLEVSPRGGRWWRFKYRFAGREKRLSMGVYPWVDLEAARLRRDQARSLLAQGLDPAEVRRQRKEQSRADAVARAQLTAEKAEPHAFSWTGLRSFDVFSDLPDTELATLAARCTWKSYPAGQTVLQRGVKEGVILVLSGDVRISSIDPLGHEVAFVQLRSGFIFGEIFVLLDQPFPLSAVTVTSSVVAKMAQGDFLALMQRYPSVQRRVMHRLAFIVEKLAQRVIELSTWPAAARVCAALLREAQARMEAQGIAQARDLWLEPSPTQQSLADALGVSREQVARILSQLARDGLVIRQGRNLHLLDIPALHARVESQGADKALENMSYARLLASIGTMREDPLAQEGPMAAI